MRAVEIESILNQWGTDFDNFPRFATTVLVTVVVPNCDEIDGPSRKVHEARVRPLDGASYSIKFVKHLSIENVFAVAMDSKTKNVLTRSFGLDITSRNISAVRARVPGG